MRPNSAAYISGIALCIGVLSSCTHRLILNDVPRNFPELSKRIPAITKHISEIPNEISKISQEPGDKVWFVHSTKGQMELIGVKRKLLSGRELESAVKALIDGPSQEESKTGIGSEIPRGTILLGLSEKDGAIEINLSRRFASDGGTDSFETRMEQLSKTVSAVEFTEPVYLNIEGHRLTMTQGEGIEVKQPINR